MNYYYFCPDCSASIMQYRSHQYTWNEDKPPKPAALYTEYQCLNCGCIIRLKQNVAYYKEGSRD